MDLALGEVARAKRRTSAANAVFAVTDVRRLGLATESIDVVLSNEAALVRVEPDGGVTVLVGTHSHGQGHETTFAQVAADEKRSQKHWMSQERWLPLPHLTLQVMVQL